MDKHLLENYVAGQWMPGPGFRFFLPGEVNRDWAWMSSALNAALERAATALGRLDAISELVPDTSQFIKTYIAKEAVESSRIEGTHTNIDEVLLKRADLADERRDDWEEVNNYIAALNNALARLETLPVSSRLISELHFTLMQGVRGQTKQPGQFRMQQNWIGGGQPPGCHVHTARCRLCARAYGRSGELPAQ